LNAAKKIMTCPIAMPENAKMARKVEITLASLLGAADASSKAKLALSKMGVRRALQPAKILVF
jgi:hypothetical protein